MDSATQKIQDILKTVKEQAKEAEYEFDRASAAITRKASHQMDLFSGSTLDRVGEIASDSRIACDELYSTYQMLVVMLDRQCRPLLEKSPEDSVIGEIAKQIKWLNDESEIENNFSSSLNGYNLGNMVKAKYFPSTESKMIQKFWESTYAMTPTAVRKKQEEQHIRKEQEEKDKKQYNFDKKNFASLQEQYESDHSLWVMKKKSIERNIQKQIADQLNLEREKLGRSEINRYYDQKKQYECTMKELEKTIKKLEDYRSGLSFTKICEKIKTNRALQEKNLAHGELKAKLEELSAQHSCFMKEIQMKVKEMESKIQTKVKKENPIPPEPRKPHPPLLPWNMMDVGENTMGVLKEIYYGMEWGRKYTVDEVAEEILFSYDYSRQKASAKLRILRENGRVERTEVNGKPLYEVIPEN